MSRAPAYPKPEDITWEPVDAAGVPAEWVIPDDCVPGRAVVYLHGGGYATGTLDSARGRCSPTSLARPARRLLAVDYRLAPEHPLPRRRRRCRHGVPLRASRPATHRRPSRSAVTPPAAGWRSATLVALRDLGDPMPGTAICLSPWTDLTLSGTSLQANRDADPMVSAATLGLMADAYLG